MKIITFSAAQQAKSDRFIVDVSSSHTIRRAR